MSVNTFRIDELCSNWWPHIPLSKMISPGMPHSMCRMCANWMPDIEEIGCGNNWPKENNRKTKSKRKLNVL
jgi:hypothetical protein